MATKRMFSRNIVETDQFADMQPLTQVLYFRFGLVADDDGIVSNYKTVMRVCGANMDNYNELLSNNYIIPFDEYRVIVITHWKINNYIQSDRYHPTMYQDVLKRLVIQDNKYIYPKENTECIQDVYNMYPEGRIGENREDKDRLGEKRPETLHCNTDETTSNPSPESLKRYGIFQRVLLSDSEHESLISKYGESLTEKYISKADRAGENRNKDIDRAVIYISRMIEEDNSKSQIIKEQEEDKNKSALKAIEKMYLDDVGR